MGIYDMNGGHFVKSPDGTQAIAYHYHTGINAGWECLITDYLKWTHRDDILPLNPGDSKGVWREFKKDYNVTAYEPCAENDYSKNLDLHLDTIIKVNDKSMNPLGSGHNIRATDIYTDIVLELRKPDGDVRYRGIVDNYKLNDDGATYVTVTLSLIPNDTWESKARLMIGMLPPQTIKYTIKFNSCFMVDFNGTYPVPTIKPTNKPTPTINPTDEPTASPTTVISVPTNNKIGYTYYSGGTLPKTGESENSNNMFYFIGIGITLCGLATYVLLRRKMI
jgi:LPXTG-motif cell wall-anchored protein